MSTTATATKAKSEEQLGGLYLTFRMGAEQYGIEILRVQEIIQMMMITPIPRTPSFVKGVVNLRGKVIPVIDLRMKFNLPTAASTEQNCIIVVDLEDLHMGVVIDSVSDVVNFPADKIDQVPSFGINLDTEFIRGIGKAEDVVTILLDIHAVITSDEKSVLNTMLAGPQES
ncbi:MAG: purine-binding chemotaxis protein CheW [Candidatus Firestonebacteria bacterium]|nr:purine-binding chemotaxis protein CheW [Candidatus Firestonebacteria bacterium]